MNLATLGTLYKWNHIILCCDWLNSFSLISSGFFHVVARVRISSLFKSWVIFQCMCTTFCLSFHLLANTGLFPVVSHSKQCCCEKHAHFVFLLCASVSWEVMSNSLDSEDMLLGFEAWLHRLLAVHPGACDVTSLCLIFLICKSSGYWKDSKNPFL